MSVKQTYILLVDICRPFHPPNIPLPNSDLEKVAVVMGLSFVGIQLGQDIYSETS